MNAKKGVSTLIAAVLLIAVTLLISLIISSSFTTLAKTQTSTVQTRTTEAVNCTSSSVDIEAVYVDRTANVSRIFLRNSGQVTENVVSVQLLNTTGVNTAATSTLPAAVEKGAVAVILFSAANVTCATFSEVIVTTECGIIKYDRKPLNC